MNRHFFDTHERGVRSHAPKRTLLWRMFFAPFFLLGGWLLLLRSDVGHTPLTTRLRRFLSGNTKIPESPQHFAAQPNDEQVHALAQAEAIQYIDEFLGIASHELRTPLTSIKLHIEGALRKLHALAAQKDVQDPDASTAQLQALLQLLERSHLSIERMNRLVGDLLTLSQIQLGNLIIAPVLFDLTAFTQSVVARQQAFAAHRQLVFEGATPIMVNADDMRIEQVLMCYLANALKYAGAEHPITIRMQKQAATVQVEVVDCGPGLSPLQQGYLFERFAQVPGIEQQQGSAVGFGFGLYLSRMIIEQQGGHVGVHSRVGEGSTFWFTLPLMQPRSVAEK